MIKLTTAFYTLWYLPHVSFCLSDAGIFILPMNHAEQTVRLFCCVSKMSEMIMASNSKHTKQSRHHQQEPNYGKLHSTSPPTSNQTNLSSDVPAVVVPTIQDAVDQTGSHLEDISELEVHQISQKYHGQISSQLPKRPHLDPHGSGRSRNMFDLKDQEPYGRRESFLQDMNHEPYWSQEKGAGSHPFQSPKSAKSNTGYFGKNLLGTKGSGVNGSSSTSNHTTTTTTITLKNGSNKTVDRNGTHKLHIDSTPLSPSQNMHSLHNLHIKHTEQPSRSSESFSQSRNSVSQTSMSQTYSQSNTQTGLSEESGYLQSSLQQTVLNTSTGLPVNNNSVEMAIPEENEMLQYIQSDEERDSTPAQDVHSGRITSYMANRHMKPLSLHKFDSLESVISAMLQCHIFQSECIQNGFVCVQ